MNVASLLRKEYARKGRETFVRKPRKRTMPLVPKPFDICREAEAKAWKVFTPNLDVLKYKETLSKAQETKLHSRAANLAWRAAGAQSYDVSEFYWEVCAWHDIFGLILNEDEVRVDKRPYRFVETDHMGNPSVKIRIPDATFGIKPFGPYSSIHGYPTYYRRDAKKEPEPWLHRSRLHSMMQNPECGLVVDGMWGETELIFPFASYEAKKDSDGSNSAEKQIHHACRTYVAMLDDLARNPNNVAEYQTKESSQFQLFAFTSSACDWKVYVVWSSLDECMVETIWKGNIAKHSDALQLIYIVDQIHDYAIKRHFPFVLKHLEAWYARAEQHPIVRNGDGILERQPRWLILDKATKKAKQDKSRETRKRNKKAPVPQWLSVWQALCAYIA